MFTSVRTPDKGDPQFEDKMARSLVGVFNESQRINGRGTCGNSAVHEWLQKERPDTAISPLKSDYCDTCKEHYTEIKRQQQIANRLRESGNARQEEVAAHDTLAQSYRLLLAEHKEIAQCSIDQYKHVRDKSLSDWKRITELQQKGCANELEEAELHQLKSSFNLCVDADYQQAKLIPHWGYFPQPGTTYYKLSNDIFGVVAHDEPSQHLYTWHEGAAGAKTSDHTITCLDHFVESLPAWVKHITFVLDNAQVNKNQFVVNWLLELVRSQRLLSARLMLMVPGHTKFAPDELFARLSHSYYRRDVFLLTDLQAITSLYGSTHYLDGADIMLWKDQLAQFYKAVPEITQLRDMVCSASPDGGFPVLKVRAKNCDGDYSQVVTVTNEAGAATVRQELKSYHSQGKSPGIAPDKMVHLAEMYDKFIDDNQRLEVLPAPECDVNPDDNAVAAVAGEVAPLM